MTAQQFDALAAALPTPDPGPIPAPRVGTSRIEQAAANTAPLLAQLRALNSGTPWAQ